LPANIDSTPAFVEDVYRKVESRLAVVRQRLGRPLSLAEKILLGHLDDPQGQDLRPGESYLALRPDRIAMQDATAQMALLQFAHAGRTQVAVPTTVHCDHLIQARVGAGPDLETALSANREVYEFLETASAKYGIGFWKPGSGIIHQVVLEQYAFPGGMMIGTDSHTPNAGGLGMLAVGVGGADAVDVMAGLPWEVLYPRRVGVVLTGQLSGWASPKDVILEVLRRLTVKGGTNKIVEYLGPGARTISCTGKATITNMGAELGATTSIFPFDEHMDRYLRATGREELADLAQAHLALLAADPEVEAHPHAFFDEVLEIDLSQLEPYVSGPHTPDLVRPVSEMAEAVRSQGYPEKLSAALIGSCTNSSYEDLTRAADVARQAQERGLRVQVPFLVTPGSEQIRATVERDGQLEAFRAIGATILANACGPCIGQWKRDEVVNAEPNPEVPHGEAGPRNAILNSFNRNFPRRNDGNAHTLSFIASPEVVVAYALAGRLTFNPLTDPLPTPDGQSFLLRPPAPAPEVPEQGFARSREGYVPPAEDPSQVEVRIRPDSDRLQRLEPFPAWTPQDLAQPMPLLLKVKGKCTTDHISPAGPWLRFRGHLDHISDNLFLGAVNAFTLESGRGRNLVTGETGLPLASIARDYKARGLHWVVVADENYGEGSSREHAAMSPRYLGAAAIVARSFARIHESNLKKQGVLPLTFVDPKDYDRVEEEDWILLEDVGQLAPGRTLHLVLRHRDGREERVMVRHSLSEEQIRWFWAGSALNLIAQQVRQRSQVS
jgi:aconitate hydratase